ncbi:MAG: DUF488 domain-containing protein [Acidimicrobiales bacterium]
MAKSAEVRVGRVYEARGDGEGARVLVDRLWPRGLAKADADIDEWCKSVAPSTELRKWYGHDPDRFEDFAGRYRAELQEGGQAEALTHLAEVHRAGPLTLLTATKQVEISAATVLAEVLRS